MIFKEKLCNDKVSFFHHNKPVTVSLDVSMIALGTILIQDNDNSLCYASHALTPVESRYSQTEKERGH
jgi:hypothetical protein